MVVLSPAFPAASITCKRSLTLAAWGSHNFLSRSSSVAIDTPTFTSRPENMSRSRSHQGAFCQQVHLEAEFQEQLATAPCQTALLLDRLPAVAGAAQKYVARLRPAQLPLENLDGVDLHVHELAPRLVVWMEPLHESSVAINAAVRAARIAVQRVIAYRTFVQNRFARGFAHDDLGRIGGMCDRWIKA